MHVLLNWSKKPTLAQFRQKTLVKQRLLLTIGCLASSASYFTALSHLTRGFLLGFGLTSLFGSLYSYSLLRNDLTLKNRYITLYDERGRLIWGITIQVTFLLLGASMLMLFLIYALMGIILPYPILLLGLLYVMMISILVIRFVLEKMI